MNFFQRAVHSVSSVFNRAPDISLARVYGGSRGQKDLSALMNEPMERSFGFEASWYDRTNSNWIAWRSSLDAILRTSIWILIGRCRDLQRTNSIVSRALNLWKNNVVGSHGIRMRMNLRDDDGKPKTEINKPIAEHWRYFCHAENLTPAGDMDMVEFQRHIFGTVPVDGTALVRVFKGREFPYGIAFKILEIDLLDVNKFEGSIQGTANADIEIKFGIESRRSTGKILAYWLYLSNPNDLSLGSTYTAGKSFRVPADEIILVMKPERPMQTIGVPWFVRAMTNLHILHAYTKATLIKAQMCASYFIFITNQIAPLDGDEGEGGDPNGPQSMPVENGLAYELTKGQDVKNVAPQNMANDMESLFKWAIRLICGDLDLAYHSLASDTSQSTYASLRMAALEERAGYISNQVWLSSRMLRPMFCKWLEVQLMTRRHLELPDAMFQQLCYAVEWIGRRWDWVDPKNESTAAIALVNGAMMSRTQYWREKGFETDDMVPELGYEQVMLEDEEIVIQTTSGQQMHFGQTDATAQVAPGKGPKAPNDDEDDEEEE